MGLKKYEIITVGGVKRVRALRSWQVGDRYVNIGDVGGIVYDEKTLSQDGACWLFRGNFGFPGARIGGDSIVDVGEAALSATGAPAVDILGSSVVVGGKLSFVSDETAAGTLSLGAADFEQGAFNFAAGANWETWKAGSASQVRTKNPIFAGGKATTLKLDVPGYTVQAFVLDRDGNGMTATEPTNTGAGVTLAIPAGQYFVLRLTKAPVSAIIPADATAAKIAFTGTYETKLSIIDSRVEINPATSTGTTTIRPGGTYTMTPGAKYPEAIIRNSKVSMMVHATANRSFRLMGQIIGSTATLDATALDVALFGQHSNVKNLMVSGALSSDLGVTAHNIIQTTNCNDLKIDPTVITPGGFNAAISANMPFIFQGCNVPSGRFYHHAQIKNTYVNIDFAKASADLGKAIASGQILASAEVEGMYRLYSTTGPVFGALVEAHDSVKSLDTKGSQNTYGTTIYKDAYFNGAFEFAGTNVFGNKVRSHPLAQVLNVAPRAVQGEFNTRTTGQIVTGVVPSTSTVSIATPFRLAGSKGLTVLTPPEGLQVLVLLTDINNKVVTNTGWVSVEASITPVSNAASFYAYISVRKTALTDLKPADVAGTQIVTYNGCRLVNTGKTAVNMEGNIRVEDNATLVNADITGTGYFGGNCVASGLILNGCAFMDNNAALAKTSEGGTVRRLYMRDNSRATISAVAVFGLLDLRDNAVFSPSSYGVSEADIIMRDNAIITSGLSANGVVTMKDSALVSGGTLTIAGDITLCGSYNQTTSKSWTGKRVIDSVDAPTYDDNVKAQYDF